MKLPFGFAFRNYWFSRGSISAANISGICCKWTILGIFSNHHISIFWEFQRKFLKLIVFQLFECSLSLTKLLISIFHLYWMKAIKMHPCYENFLTYSEISRTWNCVVGYNKRIAVPCTPRILFSLAFVPISCRVHYCGASSP